MPNLLSKSPAPTDQENRGLELALTRAIPAPRLETAVGAVPLASPEQREQAALALSELALDWSVPGLGATGTILGTIETVSYRVLAPNPYHVRDDWNDDELTSEDQEDGSRVKIDLLEQSLRTVGQQTPLKVTPLVDGDPRLAQGFQYQVIKGHRVLARLVRDRVDPVKVEILTRPDGTPFTRWDQIALYVTLKMSEKPLKAHQVVLAIAELYHARQEFCAERHLPFTFPSYRDLARRFGVSHQYAGEARSIATEDGQLLHAVGRRQIQPKAATAILKLLPQSEDRALRDKIVGAILKENGRRTATGQAELTVEEIRSEAIRRIERARPAPTASVTITPLPALPAPDTDLSPLALESPKAAELARLLLRAHVLFEELALDGVLLPASFGAVQATLGQASLQEQLHLLADHNAQGA